MKMYILGNWKISFIRFFSSEIKEDDKEKSGTQKWFISSVEPRNDGSTYIHILNMELVEWIRANMKDEE